MIKIDNIEVSGWKAAIRGMRNPKNSWDKSDSVFWRGNYEDEIEIGPNDLDLMKRLSAAGTDHGKFMRMITVTMDITAPLYWWKEFDTYKVGTVADSCSTMHKIHDKEFTRSDFSCENLSDTNTDLFNEIIFALNMARLAFNETKDKQYWWQMIQLLPTSYNQKRTVLLNYAVLKAMYHARKNHKLTEWHVFCENVILLPYSELITGENQEKS